MTAVAFVGAAAVGAVARSLLASRLNRDVPVGTLSVNLLASLAAGMVAGSSDTADVVVVVGFLGALSTWSTLAGELVGMVSAERHRAAVLYGLVSVVGGIALAWIGLRSGA